MKPPIDTTKLGIMNANWIMLLENAYDVSALSNAKLRQ